MDALAAWLNVSKMCVNKMPEDFYRPEEQNERKLEKVFFSNEENKDRLRTLNILPLSHYLELHYTLSFIDIINNKFDYLVVVQCNEQSFTWQRLGGEFPVKTV